MRKLLLLIPLLLMACDTDSPSYGGTITKSSSGDTTNTYHYHYYGTPSVLVVPAPFPVYNQAERCP